MINLAASRPEREISPTRVCTTECHGNLPRAVVKVGVPRGPGAVEGKGQLLVVLVLLTPHPEGGEHFLETGDTSASTDHIAEPERASDGRHAQTSGQSQGHTVPTDWLLNFLSLPPSSKFFWLFSIGFVQVKLKVREKGPLIMRRLCRNTRRQRKSRSAPTLSSPRSFRCSFRWRGKPMLRKDSSRSRACRHTQMPFS